ncbi:GpE family phage tail protein [Candidatus Haliotispira prima]|uniref:GpE family phage tail protein n=1 Tax=Candidatus Haliotispira prima TaxID=3034016 RepID=A0ABY8MEG0_9SPIO|nr:GpE family phage tail protein [Candidatus Haliotispira prima]
MSDLLIISHVGYSDMLGMKLSELEEWHKHIVKRYNEIHGAK